MRRGDDSPGYRAGYSDGAFDAALAEYQAREREAAARRADQGDVESRRPDAVVEETTFGELRVGDFITNEPKLGREARFVKVIAHAVDGESVDLTFEVPQPLGVGYHTRWCIDRRASDVAFVDVAARSVTA